MPRFVPPRCPNRACPMHRAPRRAFFVRRGHYLPKCRRDAVPRFRCKVCRRGFSFQTFRADYRDHRPHDNEAVFHLLTSGVGLRQTGRLRGMNVGTLQRKFRKLSRHLRRLNRNLLQSLPANRTFVMDELETFESSSICAVTVPVVVDAESKLVVATSAAPIRRMANKGTKRRQRLERLEKERGRRHDRSRSCIRLVVRRLGDLLGGAGATLRTDQKPLYRSAVRAILGDRVRHETTSSRLPRTARNPLFAVNLTETMLRDNCSRLRRLSWLFSKNRRQLRQHLDFFSAYRNWHRPRNNGDAARAAPGVILRLIERNLTGTEMLAWRQDWGRLSVHPSSTDATRHHDMITAA